MTRKAHLSSRLKWNGLVFETKNYGEVVVVEDFISCDQVVVRFKATGNIITTTASQLKAGSVKDTSVPTGCVVGDIKTVSGDVTCHSNVDGNVNTVSGDVTTFGNIYGNVKTVSGDVQGV